VQYDGLRTDDFGLEVSMNDKLNPPFDLQLDTIPTLPGVYLMKGKEGDVLYVGKANNLRARIKQYWLPGGDGRFMVPFLIAKVHAVETIVVTSEKEALLLENNLIKKHQPKYNALLKDDKTYIALKVTTRSTWPTIQLVRYRGRPEADGLYFGPYTSALAARGTLDLLNRLFPLRQCSDQEFARRTRPCILYEMKRCIAPCVGKCTKEEYDQLVDKTVKFLRGQDKVVLKELHREMEQAAEALEFERAGNLLRTIQQIEKTIESQHVDKPLGTDADALGIYRQGEDVIVSQLLIRSGKLLGSQHYDFKHIAENDAELLESFLVQHYGKHEELPHEILLPIPVEASEAIQELLSTGKKRKVDIFCPQKGDKRHVIDMAMTNAQTTFKQRKDENAIREKTLLDMQERLHLSRYPKRIECFDNSNIGGAEPVSAMVAFTDGVKDRARYRKYKVKTVVGPDDYATMMEVLMRRYKRGKEENDLPDLLIVDGGKGHLNVALKVMADLNIITVDIISVAKEQGRHDKGITAEQVFLPNVKDPVFLRPTSPILYLLQQIRDEAHRFAITFHRKRRNKATLSSEIEGLTGIGPVKRKRLLRHFGSVKKLAEATEEDLKQLSWLSQANRQTLMQFIQSKQI
jgi:excinuclease ABC subunit C